MKKFIISLFLILAALMPASEVKAQTCFASITPLNFGTINVVANVAYAATATITYTCIGTPLANMRVCTNIGEGTGGSAGPVPRYMLSGATQLNMNLYTTPTYSNIFGSSLWAWAASYPGAKDGITIGTGSFVSYSKTIYARVLAGQTTKPPGTYTSSFSGGHIAIQYDYNASTPCSTAPTKMATASFTATAIIPSACLVSATTLDFGSQSALTANVDTTSTITAQCTTATPYTISLNGGTSGASNPAARKMLSPGGTGIIYGIYRDAARLSPWGNTIGTNTAAGTGTGSNQNFTVYGRVAPQTTPLPDTYTDTISVTVTY